MYHKQRNGSNLNLLEKAKKTFKKQKFITKNIEIIDITLATILVKVFTCKAVEEYQPEEKDLVIQDSIDKFVEWLSIDISNMEDPKVKAMAIRLKASHHYHNPKIFEKFPELEGYVMRAYDDFINSLKVG